MVVKTIVVRNLFSFEYDGSNPSLPTKFLNPRLLFNKRSRIFCRKKAKIASDFKKPDMVHTLYPSEIATKMWTLPVSELFMLGRKTVPKLQSMRIRTIGDLAKTD